MSAAYWANKEKWQIGEKTMPMVGNKKFAYTKAGKKKAKAYAKKSGKKMTKKKGY